MTDRTYIKVRSAEFAELAMKVYTTLLTATSLVIIEEEEEDQIQTVSPSIYTDEVPIEYAKELAQYVEQFYTAEEEVAEIM